MTRLKKGCAKKDGRKFPYVKSAASSRLCIITVTSESGKSKTFVTGAVEGLAHEQYERETTEGEEGDASAPLAM